MQEQQAVLVINSYAEALNVGKNKGKPTPKSDTQANKVSGDDLFKMMGVQIKGQ